MKELFGNVDNLNMFIHPKFNEGFRFMDDKQSVNLAKILYNKFESSNIKNIVVIESGTFPLISIMKKLKEYKNCTFNLIQLKIPRELNFNLLAWFNTYLSENEKQEVIDYNGNRISDFFKEIRILDNGYIVKKDNGKNVYLDDNLNIITQEYDIIDCSKIKDNILIVSNYIQDKYNKNNYFNLISLKNGQIIGENYEYIGGMENYNSILSTNSYYTNYTKIFDNLNYKNINTELYEMFYN